MALANGMDTYKLKYGHRGGNHPVKDLETGRVYISSQNHGYAVDTNTVKPEIAVPAFVNVNDGTNEGLKYTGKNIFTVQYHPEVNHSVQGRQMLKNFLFNVCGCKGDWLMSDFAEKSIQALRERLVTVSFVCSFRRCGFICYGRIAE